MKFTPSRTLNEPSSFMGLSIWDLSGLGYLLVFSHQALTPFGLEILSFLIAGLSALLILKLRLSGRKRLIRDYLYFLAKRTIL